MAININVESRINKVETAFKTSKEVDIVPFTLSTTAKIPGIKERLACKDIKKTIEHLGLVLLHKLYRKEIDLQTILNTVEFNVADTIAKVKGHISGKVRPGVTKNGFGPIHAIEIFEKMAKKKDDSETLKAFFIMATMQPFMEIVGLDYFVLQSEYDEVEIDDDRLNDVIRASRLLECYYACVGMCEEKKRQVNKNDYFSIENWVIFLRSLKNLLNLEADKVELFESAIEELSVLLTASKLGITNKSLVIYGDLLNSNEANSLKENHQIINRGLSSIGSLPTILASSVTVDRLKFNIKNVFSAFNGEVFVKNTPFILKGGCIDAYTDVNLKGHIRGSMLVATEFVERPIQVIKKLEESNVYYSYSTEGFANMGKVITESANSLYNLMLHSVYSSIDDVKYYAINSHYTNLSEEDMRKLLYVLAPNSVYMYVPLSIKDTSSDELLSKELEKISYLYRLNSIKDFLEYDTATGFKVLGSVLLKSPYLVLLKALNPNSDKHSVYTGEREKAYLKQLSYDMCVLRDIDTFNLDYKNSEIKFAKTVDSISVSFDYNSRELLKLSTAGNYHLDSKNYTKALQNLNDVKKSMLKILKNSYKDIYKKVEDEEKFEADRRFELAAKVINDNLLLKDMARRIRHTVMQSLIDDAGGIREDVNMFQINELMNGALLHVLEHLAKEILGEDFTIDDEIKDNNKIKKSYLGGSYENFIN